MSDARELPLSATFDPDRWATFWLRVAGVALLVGFFTPTHAFQGSGVGGEGPEWDTLGWSWSHVAELPPWAQVRVFAPLLLGGLGLLLSRSVGIRYRRKWLMIGSLATLFLYVVPDGSGPIPEFGPWWAAIWEHFPE